MPYGFIRDTRNAPSYEQMRAAGLQPLYNASDPGLEQAIAGAKAAGLQYGIWDAPYGRDPRAYAQGMAQMSQRYAPSLLVDNTEIEGKGYRGSKQWDYSQQAAAYARQLMPNQQLAVAPMGMQDDFNYGAYTSNGIKVMPQAYAGAYNGQARRYTTSYDPNSTIQRVIANGVDPSMVLGAILGPGQDPGSASGNYSLYALDDFGGQFPSARPGQPVRALPPTPALAVPAAQRPGATPSPAHAHAQLQRLSKMGLLPGVPKGNASDNWRQLTRGVAATMKALRIAPPRPTRPAAKKVVAKKGRK